MRKAVRMCNDVQTFYACHNISVQVCVAQGVLSQGEGGLRTIFMGYGGSDFNPDCGIAYTDESFEDVLGGAYTESNCSLGIGQNNSGAYCSLRMSSCSWSSVSQHGQAATCDVSRTDEAVISLWVR